MGKHTTTPNQDFKRYRGEWVILRGDTVVAHDVDLATIMRTAEELADDDIVIDRVPETELCIY